MEHYEEIDIEPVRHDVQEQRHCLKCGTAFISSWRGERICKRCKQSGEWKNSTGFDPL